MVSRALSKEDRLPPPSLLLFQLKARRCTVGELIDFAENIPLEWVADTASSLSDTISRSDDDPQVRRRKLVLLGALLNRLIFEAEEIPKSRAARI